MNYSENISFNLTRQMKNELETIGLKEEKKLSSVIRELLLKGIRENRNEYRIYEND